MKGIYFMMSFIGLLTGCSSTQVQDYRNEKPVLVLEDYLNGHLEAPVPPEAGSMKNAVQQAVCDRDRSRKSPDKSLVTQGLFAEPERRLTVSATKSSLAQPNARGETN